MRTIDIKTTQNVHIEYEAANLGDRILAFVIDQSVLWLTLFLINLCIVFGLGSMDIAPEPWIYLWFVLPIYLFYTLAFEILNNGQTIGKRALRIKVVDVNGKQPEPQDLILRWSFRMIDIWFTMGSLASVMILSGDYSQRLGGRVSNTSVVRLSSKKYLELQHLLRIENIQDYTPRYPQVRQLNEKEMLLLKSSIDRYEKYRNEAHKEALLRALEKIKEFTGIQKGEESTLSFARYLVQDYVVLTR